MIEKLLLVGGPAAGRIVPFGERYLVLGPVENPTEYRVALVSLFSNLPPVRLYIHSDLLDRQVSSLAGKANLIHRAMLKANLIRQAMLGADQRELGDVEGHALLRLFVVEASRRAAAFAELN